MSGWLANPAWLCESHSQEWWVPWGWKNLEELNYNYENAPLWTKMHLNWRGHVPRVQEHLTEPIFVNVFLPSPIWLHFGTRRHIFKFNSPIYFHPNISVPFPEERIGKGLRAVWGWQERRRRKKIIQTKEAWFCRADRQCVFDSLLVMEQLCSLRDVHYKQIHYDQGGNCGNSHNGGFLICFRICLFTTFTNGQKLSLHRSWGWFLNWAAQWHICRTASLVLGWGIAMQWWQISHYTTILVAIDLVWWCVARWYQVQQNVQEGCLQKTSHRQRVGAHSKYEFLHFEFEGHLQAQIY